MMSDKQPTLIAWADAQVEDWVRYTVRGDDNYVGMVLDVNDEGVFLADGVTVPNAGIKEIWPWLKR
jgi:hypothetical protein